MQVLSNSVSKALKVSGGSEVEETAHFIELVNNYFDCLNVRNLTTGIHQRNKFLDSFRPNDFRVKVSTSYW